MEYNNAPLEGGGNLLLIGLLEIIKSNKHLRPELDVETNQTRIIYPKQNKLTYTPLEKIRNLYSFCLVDKKAKNAKIKNTIPFLRTINF